MLVITLEFPRDGGAGPESVLDAFLGLVRHILEIIWQFLKVFENIALVLHIKLSDLEATVLVACVKCLIKLFDNAAC